MHFTIIKPLPKYLKILKLCISLSLICLYSTFLVAQNSAGIEGLKRVVIDAGHGGTDPGCHGLLSKEKDICLKLALNLGAIINKEYPDVEVIYTRKTDTFIKLHERAKIANTKNANLFLSIHANSAANTSAFGTETYVMGLHKSEENLEVAKRENSVILLEDNYQLQYNGFDPNSVEDVISLTITQSAYLEQSLHFASLVQDGFTKLGRKNRGVKQAGYLVLHQTTMPSVLIEVGFLSNKAEEVFLTDKTEQKKMSEALFAAFKKYKTHMDQKANQINNVGSGNATEKKIIQDTLKPKEEINVIAKEPNKIEDEKDQTQKKSTAEIENKDSIPAIKVIAPKEEILVESKNSAEAEKIVFSVQIKSSAKAIALLPENFKGLIGVKEYISEKTYKYIIGESDTLDELLYLQNKVRSLGYTDAFVVAFADGNRIPIKKALDLLKVQN